MAKENRIAVCRRHWSAFFLPGLIGVIFFVLGIASLKLDDWSAWYLIIPLIIVVGCAGYIYISYQTTYILLTTTSVIGHKGFIKSHTLTAPLSKVQDMGLSNGLGGKILGYHTVTLSSAGSARTEFVFPHMARAQKFVDAVQETIAEAVE